MLKIRTLNPTHLVSTRHISHFHQAQHELYRCDSCRPRVPFRCHSSMPFALVLRTSRLGYPTAATSVSLGSGGSGNMLLHWIIVNSRLEKSVSSRAVLRIEALLFILCS